MPYPTRVKLRNTNGFQPVPWISETSKGSLCPLNDLLHAQFCVCSRLGHGRYVDQLQQEESKRTDAKETSGSNRVRKLVGDINTAARQWMWLMKDAKDPLYPAANLYFGGATTVDGLLDFMIWRRQADQLGIQLTDQDIAAAVR